MLIMDKKNIFIQAIGKFLLGVIILGLLIFLPAGSLQYWQGWLLMGILFVPARNSQREMMGMDRWVEMVMRGGDLLKAVQEYMGQAEPIDDITLMTICKKEFIGPK